ncbi:MAG: cystathionine gamma-synthase family protein [Nitrososphaerales archaeon]|nr:cystathionine gamma-synthase family protein [Nitrososphaerales archaeon]
MKDILRESGIGTRALWAGEEGSSVGGPTQVPIVQSVAFSYKDFEEWHNVALGRRRGHIYSRNTNPTVSALEEKVRALEGAEAAVSFASGMAAISNALYTILRPGDRVVTIKDTYGGTNQLFREFLPEIGVKVTFCDTTDIEQIEKEVAKGCKVVYLETPTNPTLKVVDIARVAEAAHAGGTTVLTDNTFATPVNQLPLKLGSDAVIHSASKFLGGHADALGGIFCGQKAHVKKVFHFREINGAALDPFAAYLLLRGLKTLQIRVERQNANAMKIAEHLEGHDAVREVYYPGLKSHPQHEVARRQMRGGFGGVLSFTLKGGHRALKTFLPKLRLAHRAANLGAVETTVGSPATTSHVEVSARDRAAMGIPEALVRYSTGIEDVEDLIADLDRALASVRQR